MEPSTTLIVGPSACGKTFTMLHKVIKKDKQFDIVSSNPDKQNLSQCNRP